MTHKHLFRRPLLLSLALLAMSGAACSDLEGESPTLAIRQALQGTIPAEGGTVTGTTGGASQFTAPCSAGQTSQSPEHVYAWTPSLSGEATLSTCGASTVFDTVLYVTANSDGSGQLACNDDTPGCALTSGDPWGSKVTMTVTAGTTYYIYVDGWDADQHGQYALTVLAPQQAPLQGTIPPSGGTITGTTAAGPGAYGASCSESSSRTTEHVYAWTPSTSGPATISSCSPNMQFDPVLYVASTPTGVGQLACNDDTSGCNVWNGEPWGSTLNLNVTAGTTYYLYVDGYDETQSGNYSVTVTPPPCTGMYCASDVPGNIKIDTHNYMGKLCLNGIGCTQEGVGGVVGFTVAPGEYGVSAPFTGGPDMGSVSVDAAGNLTPHGNLTNFFTIQGSFLVAKTSPVHFQFDGPSVSFGFAGVGGASDTWPEPWLLWGRSYSIGAAWAWDPVIPGSWSLSPTGYGLSLTDDGTAVVLDEGGAKRYFDQDPATPLVLKPRWAEISVNSGGFYGGVSFYGIGGAGPVGTIKLLKGRKYWMATGYSSDLDRNDWLYATEPDLTIVDNGASPATLIVDPSSQRYVTADPIVTTRLNMNVAPVSIDFRGANVSGINIYGIGAFVPGIPTILAVGRRYALFTSWGQALDRDDPGVGAGFPAFSFGVEYNGQSVTVDTETGKHLEPVAGSATAKVVVSHVTIDPNGYTGPLCIPNVGCVQGAPGTLHVMAGRRYQIQGAGVLSVIDPDTCSTVPSSLTVGGRNVLINCSAANPFVTVDVKRDLGGMTVPVAGATVDVYHGAAVVTSATTNSSGVATLMLPGDGPYRFHTEWWGEDFWSSTSDDCSPWACPKKIVTVSGVEVTVRSIGQSPVPGVSVNAYTGGPAWSTLVGALTTNQTGVAQIGLPPGDYRFKTSVIGLDAWSGDCSVPVCATATVQLAGSRFATFQAAAVAPGQVNLTWSDRVGGAQMYRLQRSLNSRTPDIIELPGSATSYIDTGVAPNSAYAYVIAPIGTADENGVAYAKVTTPEETCFGKPNGFSCSDGNPCNGPETCQSQRCSTGQAIICSSGEACDSATGSCVTVPSQYAAMDVTAAIAAGTYVFVSSFADCMQAQSAGTVLCMTDWDADGTPDAYYNAAGEVIRYVPSFLGCTGQDPGAVCGDPANKCMVSTCAGGICTTNPKVCDDGDENTFNECIPDTGCSFPPKFLAIDYRPYDCDRARDPFGWCCDGAICEDECETSESSACDPANENCANCNPSTDPTCTCHATCPTTFVRCDAPTSGGGGGNPPPKMCKSQLEQCKDQLNSSLRDLDLNIHFQFPKTQTFPPKSVLVQAPSRVSGEKVFADLADLFSADGPNQTTSSGHPAFAPASTGTPFRPETPETAKSSDPITIEGGELIIQHTDLALPGTAVPFALVRTYRSRSNTRSFPTAEFPDGLGSALGNGWDHSYNQRIYVDAKGATLGTGAATAIYFRITGNTGTPPFFPVYTAPERVTMKLFADQSPPDAPPISGQPYRFRLVESSGIERLFDKDGLLRVIRDQNHIGVTIGWEQVGDEFYVSGVTLDPETLPNQKRRVVNFNYQTSNGHRRLTSIDLGYRNNTTDSTLSQLKVDYVYHPTGDLDYVIDSARRVERYRYHMQGPTTGPIIKSIPAGAVRGACADACAIEAQHNFGSGTCPVVCREQCLSSCATRCFGTSSPQQQPNWVGQNYNQAPSGGTSPVDQCIDKERTTCAPFFAAKDGDLEAIKDYCKKALADKKTPCSSGDCSPEECEVEAQKKLANTCNKPGMIAAECGNSCLNSCQQQLQSAPGGCPFQCDAACEDVSLAGQVADTCAATCVEMDWKAGAKYGLLRDLNHDIIEVRNANLDVVAAISYHEDIDKPSFDTVDSQVVAGRSLSMDVRRPTGLFTSDHTTFCPADSLPVGSRSLVSKIVDYTDPYGKGWVYKFDAYDNKLSEQNLSTGAVRRFDYDKAGRLVGAQEPGGAYTCFDWEDGELKSSEHFPAPNAAGERESIKTAFTWQNFGETSPLYGLKMSRLKQASVAGQQVFSASYDPTTGNLLTLTSPTGKITAFLNYSSGRPGTIILPNLGIVELEYRNGALSKRTTMDALEAAPQVGTIVEELVANVAGQPEVGTSPFGEVTGWHWEAGHVDYTTVRNVDTAGGNTPIDTKTSYTYDIENRVQTQSDGRKKLTFTYDLTDSVKQVELESLTENLPKQVTCYVNGPDGRRLAMKGPDGNTLGYGYDGEGRLTQVRLNHSSDRGLSGFGTACATPAGVIEGVLLDITYDLDGRVKSIKRGLNSGVTSVTYDGHGRPIAFKDATGAAVVQGYDKQGRVRWRATYDQLAAYGYEKPANSAVAGLIGMEELTYYPDSRLETRKEWSFSRRPAGAPEGNDDVEDHGTLIWKYVYNDGARTVTITDPMSGQTTVTSDGQGRTRKVNGPGGVWTADYNMWDRVVDTTSDYPNAAGKLVRRTRLTSWGDVQEVLEGAARIRTQQVTYDQFKRVETEQGEGSGGRFFSYDDYGRPHTIEELNAGTLTNLTTLAWNPIHNQVQSRTSESFGGLTAITSYLYDDLGRLKRVTRPGGGKTLYCHEGVTGLVSREARPDKTLLVNEYGAGDQLSSVEAGYLSSLLGDEEDVCTVSLQAPRFTSSLMKTFSYDGLGRPFAATRSKSPGSPDPEGINPNIQLRWNSLGELIRETTGSFEARVVADAPTSGTRTWRMKGGNAPVPTVDVQETRDTLGRLTGVSADEPSGGPLGFLTQEYQGFGPVKYRTFGNYESTSTFEYNDLGRLTALIEGGPTLDTRWDWTVPLDGVPRRSVLQRTGINTSGGLGSSVSRTAVFHLDEMDRLLGEDNGVPAGGGPNLSSIVATTKTTDANALTGPWFGQPTKPQERNYELDGRGNWKSRTTVNETLLPMPNVFDVYTTAYGSDNAGNMVNFDDEERGFQVFAYDAFGNLKSATGEYGTKTYAYDAFDRLVQETKTPTGGTPESVHYAHLGAKRFLRHNPDGSFQVTVDGDGIDEHLLEVTTAATGTRQVRHYHQDRSGSVYMMTDHDGRPVEFYDYTAYGEQTIVGADGATTRTTSAIGNTFGFQGHPADPDTGLVQMRNRWYLPKLGRFMSADPIGLAGGSNLFAFAASAPVKYGDPFGLNRQAVDPAAMMRNAFDVSGTAGLEVLKNPYLDPFSHPYTPPPRLPDPGEMIINSFATLPASLYNAWGAAHGAGPPPGGYFELNSIRPFPYTPENMSMGLAGELIYGGFLQSVATAGVGEGISIARGALQARAALAAVQTVRASELSMSVAEAAAPTAEAAFGSRINTGVGIIARENCPFCTAGGSSSVKVTSSQVAALTGMPEGGLSLQQTGQLFRRMGLGNGQFQSFNTLADAAKFMRSFPVGTKFGVAYENPGVNWGHVIAGQRTSIGLVFRDFQASGLPWIRPQGVRGGAAFSIFPF